MSIEKKPAYGLYLFIISVILLVPGLGLTPLWIYDEVRNAECAREMFERRDWIVPTFNGELRTLKPPLHYFFMFAGFEMFGITEWGARIFSSIFGILTILTVYFFVKRYSSPLHAFITGLVLLLSTHFLFQFRMSVPDPYLIYFNALAIFSAFAYFHHKRLYWILLAGVSLGLGTLAKGPVSVALPGLSLLVWLIWERKWKMIFHWHILLAGVVMIAVALPWYWLVHVETEGAWTRGFFLEHNIGRFSEPMEGHGGIFLLVPLFVLVGLLPGSAWVGESFKRSFREKNSLWKLGLSVTITFLVFYSISGTKLPNYPMPCYPFLALLLGFALTHAWENPFTARRYPFFILLIISIALPVAGYLGIKNEVNTRGLEDHAFFLLLLTGGVMMATVFTFKNKFRPALVSLAITYFIFNLIFLLVLYPTIYQRNPMSMTITEVKKHKNVVAYQIFHPSYTYYLPERVPVFYQLDSLAAYLQEHEAAVLSRQQFAGELKSIGLNEKAAVHDLFESHTTVVYSNRESVRKKLRAGFRGNTRDSSGRR